MTTLDTQLHRPEAHPMILVDCPLCDGAAPYDADTAALECPSCAIRLEVADEPHAELAAAA